MEVNFKEHQKTLNYGPGNALLEFVDSLYYKPPETSVSEFCYKIVFGNVYILYNFSISLILIVTLIYLIMTYVLLF